MHKTPAIRRLAQHLKTAIFADQLGISSRDAITLRDEVVHRQQQNQEASRLHRRTLLKSTAGAIAGTVAAGTLGSVAAQTGSKKSSNLSVGIVGAGMAGLLAARQLIKQGANVSLYEASNRIGGRVLSLAGVFPGQVAELGGELIDTAHKTMLNLAREFSLEVEDVNKTDGDVFYHFLGRLYDEAEVVDQFRDFVPVMKEEIGRAHV